MKVLAKGIDQINERAPKKETAGINVHSLEAQGVECDNDVYEDGDEYE